MRVRTDARTRILLDRFRHYQWTTGDTLVLLIAYAPVKISFANVGAAIVDAQMKSLSRDGAENLVKWLDTASKLKKVSASISPLHLCLVRSGHFCPY